LLAGVSALFLAGCGTGHYQAMMAEEQERIQRIDEEDKLLDNPLKLPGKKSDDKSPARPVVFFRPPKGFGSNAEVHPQSSTDLVLYRYPAPAKSGSPFLDISFAAESLEPDKFWTELLKAFPGAKRDSTIRVEKPSPGRDKLVLEELQHEHYLIYVYPALKPQLAVVFHIDPAKRDDPPTRKLMDISLGSLAVGQEAARFQRAVEQRKKHSR
jgi:hypothetical protein